MKITLYFYSNFVAISHGTKEQKADIGSDKGFAPNRRQAIVWSYAGLV